VAGLGIATLHAVTGNSDDSLDHQGDLWMLCIGPRARWPKHDHFTSRKRARPIWWHDADRDAGRKRRLHRVADDLNAVAIHRHVR
jgi:hypothetical protein